MARNKWRKIKTRMHSSWMRTACTLPYGGGCDRDSSRLRPPDRDTPCTETPCTETREPQTETPQTETPGQRPPSLDREPQRTPRQRSLDRHPQTETPLDRGPPPCTETREPQTEIPGQRPLPRTETETPRGQTDTCESIAFANLVLAGGKNSGKLEGIALLEEASLHDKYCHPTGYLTIQYLELYFYVCRSCTLICTEESGFPTVRVPSSRTS